MQPQMFPPGGPTLPGDPQKFSFLTPLLVWASQIAAAFNQSLAPTATTSGRPTAQQLSYLPSGGVGFSLLDTTLNRPVWWTGSGWVDATGTSV